MKYLKMLGLAAVAAMALTAFIGASSVSATVLCTTTPAVGTACGTGWHVDKIVASVVGTFSFHSTGGGLEATCTVAGATAEKNATGSSTTTPVGTVSKANLPWGFVNNGCTNTTDTIAGGELEFHWTSGDNGTMTAKGFEVTVVLAGVSCTFGFGAGKSIGDLTGGAPAIMHVNLVAEKTAGSFLCPTTARWTGTFQITNHTAVYVVPS